MQESFDVPARQFDFKTDLSFGQKGESLVSSFLDSLSGGSFEVKSDRYRNGRMVVETDQNPRGIRDNNGNQIWHKSGINVTTAKWWVYVFSMDEAFVIINVDRLKRYLRLNKPRFNENTKINLGGKDNPARGFLLMPQDVIDLMRNSEYDLPA
jgi:hypothetical protein